MNQHVFLLVFCIIFTFLVPEASSLDLPHDSQEKSDAIKRLEVTPSVPHPSVYEGKLFSPNGYFSDKIFLTKNYVSHQHFATTSYATRSFLGIKNPWLGKKVILQHQIFPSHQLSTMSYKKAEVSYVIQQRFLSHQANLEPKAQGGLDHDEALHQALKKKMTTDDVRELLNKQL